MKLYRIPIGGWTKCVHEAAAFESKGEYAVATILDRSETVEWWLRNDPPVLRIPTPIGYFEPDFVYRSLQKGAWVLEIVEVKGSIFWDGEGSEARLKALAACEWVRVTNAADTDTRWEFSVVLDQDSLSIASLEGLRSDALVSCPEQYDDDLNTSV